MYASNNCAPCTVFNLNPLQTAAGSGVTFVAGQVGFLIILVGLILIGVAMADGRVFSKASGYLGILTGLEGIVGSFVFSSLNGTSAAVTSLIPFVLLAIWTFSATPRLLKL